MTERDIIRNGIEWNNLLLESLGEPMVDWEEKGFSIRVVGGPKYMFTSDGMLKSVITGGKSFGPHGENSYRSPK